MSDEVQKSPLAGIWKFESRGKTVHSHYDGREIQRSFYLKPYSKAPAVTEALLGSVVSTTGEDGEGATWIRKFPAQDPAYPECYCNEVRVEQIDPRAIAFSDALDVGSIPEIAVGSAEAHAKFMAAVNGTADNPAGGCFLTASYRPLISGYRWHSDRHEYNGQIFDWIDPHFKPGVRTVPWPDGLVAAVKQYQRESSRTWADPVPDEVAQPVNVPVLEFTIRRLLVGEVPYGTLNPLLNSVNEAPWPLPESRYALPLFAKGTLRFDTYEVINHYSTEPNGKLWYELVYHFSWLNFKTSPVFDEDAELAGEEGHADVTWNHTLMRPSPWAGDVAPLGWYWVTKCAAKGVTPTTPRVRGEPLYAFADFDPLFRLNP